VSVRCRVRDYKAVTELDVHAPVGLLAQSPWAALLGMAGAYNLGAGDWLPRGPARFRVWGSGQLERSPYSTPRATGGPARVSAAPL